MLSHDTGDLDSVIISESTDGLLQKKNETIRFYENLPDTCTGSRRVSMA
jgi:hypothetical protein